MDRIKVVIVEDQDLTRKSLGIVLGMAPDIEIVGAAENGKSCGEYRGDASARYRADGHSHAGDEWSRSDNDHQRTVAGREGDHAHHVSGSRIRGVGAQCRRGRLHSEGDRSRRLGDCDPAGAAGRDK